MSLEESQKRIEELRGRLSPRQVRSSESLVSNVRRRPKSPPLKQPVIEPEQRSIEEFFGPSGLERRQVVPSQPQEVVQRPSGMSSSTISVDVRRPTPTQVVENPPPIENPPVSGSMLTEYVKPSVGFVGLSLLGGLISGFSTGLGREAIDAIFHKPNKDPIIIKDERPKEDEKDKHPVIVNQIGLNVENIQRQTTSRSVQRRKQRR